MWSTIAKGFRILFPCAPVLFVTTWTTACIVVKTVTHLLSHHFIANSGPLHLKTAYVFFSFAVVTAFGRPFLFGCTVPQAYVEWKKKFLIKFWTCIKIVHIHVMPFVQRVYWIHKPHNKFCCCCCCCCCTAWIQNLCSLYTSCLVLSSVNIKCTYVTIFCLTYLKQFQVALSQFFGIINVEPHSL